MRERYVLLGLAPARADWFRTVSRWASAAVLPAEFVRCVSVQELRARLASGRRFSAVLVDAGVPGLDRDLIAEATRTGPAVLVVSDGRVERGWAAIGAAAVLAPAFSRDELMEVLAATATMVGAGHDADVPAPVDEDAAAAAVVAVTGPGGTGASTAAIALAQGLAGSPPATSVLLADLCLDADQAMLHDTGAVVPGLQELVEAHRAGAPARAVVLEQTFEVPARGYRLLLGLRRHRHWVALRPRAVEAALDQLQRAVDVVVADVEPDVEGEADTGSVEVEDRNLLARAAVARADVVVVVGEPSMKGVHALARTLLELLELGVPAERLCVVINRARRGPRARAELTRAVAELVGASAGLLGAELPTPVFLPDRREVERALRDVAPLPAAVVRPVTGAVRAALERVPAHHARMPEPVPVVPGSLGGLGEAADLGGPGRPADGEASGP